MFNISSVTRSADGQIVNIDVQGINAAGFTAIGVDLEAHYDHLFRHGGSLALALTASYYDDLTFIQSANDPSTKDEQVDTLGRPEYRGLLHTSYALGPWQLGWDVRFTDSSKISNDAQPEEVPVNQVDSVTYHDLNLRYWFNEEIELFAGVNNLTDEEPPSTLNLGNLRYDAIGRYYFAGVRISIGGSSVTR